MNLRLPTIYLFALVAGSVLASTIEIVAYWRDIEPSSFLLSVWPTAFLVLLVLWIVEDGKTHPNIERPFDYGLFVFVWALPYLPYYLWRTRGLKGLALLAGFVVLYLLAFIGHLVIDAAG